MSRFKSIVFFDMETTGLDIAVCDIIQLSAICGDRVFNAYILPRHELTESAKIATGFTVSGGTLYRRGKPLDTVSLYEAVTFFLGYLRAFSRPVLLAAHGARRFDAPMLVRVLLQFSLQQEFLHMVLGFLDSFLLASNVYHGLASYSLVTLANYFLGQTYDAHNAVEDARMLQKLFNVWGPNRQTIQRFVYNAEYIFNIA
ncbi:DNA polymerase III PolC-type-like isoform X2 [Notolabrus celidotus]|nr:DNA polymerase III PolC-type-like isoform X2 [Notolabrus celidotus]